MSISRREFLRLASVVASGTALASCSPVYRQVAQVIDGADVGPPLPPDQLAALRRLTFGPGPADRAGVVQMGLTGWLEGQLTPGHIEDTSASIRLRSFNFLEQDANALVGWEKEALIQAFKQATLLRQIYSDRQLYELMVEFWTDHFNIAIPKGDCWFLKVVDDREVIRAHALGNFKDLLWASAHSPAMMIYLDNQANHRDAPNENYARELMELHTLGVDGGYSQKDVMELARCLTGWTVKEHFWRGDFTFEPDLHDPHAKKVLGLRIEPSGQQEAELVLEHLATHPSTALHIARKLVMRFVSDRPEKRKDLIDRAHRAFLTSGGDILATLRPILFDGVARMPLHPEPKFKRPVDFLVSALRTLNVQTTGGPPLQEYLGRMGQPLYEWPTPDGPPSLSDAWIGNLMPRWKFALALARNEIEGTELNLQPLFGDTTDSSTESHFMELSGAILGGNLPAAVQRDLVHALDTVPKGDRHELPSIITAGLIASPAFQWR